MSNSLAVSFQIFPYADVGATRGPHTPHPNPGVCLVQEKGRKTLSKRQKSGHFIASVSLSVATGGSLNGPVMALCPVGPGPPEPRSQGRLSRTFFKASA